MSDTPSLQLSSQAGKVPTQAQTRRVEQKKHSCPQSDKYHLLTSSGPQGLTSHEGSHSASHNKWEELCEPEIPVPFLVWGNVMKCVDKDPSRVKRGMVDLGYHVPEPAQFLLSPSPSNIIKHHKNFMMNWLAIHPLWISRLDHDPPHLISCTPTVEGYPSWHAL